MPETQNQPTTNQKSKSPFRKNKQGFTKNFSGSKRNQRPRNKGPKKQNNRPKPVQHGPVYEYACECHGLPAIKPATGQKTFIEDPEKKKAKEVIKGLGKWRCATTRKVVKVQQRKPQPASPVVESTPNEPTIGQ
jgi:hypothetical protein